MNPNEFWLLVRQVRGEGRSSDGEMAARLTHMLATRGAPQIAAFRCALSREIAALDLHPLREVADQLWVLSDEAWVSFRAWCVSQGEEFVLRITRHPASLRTVAARSAGPFDAPSGDLFMHCADYARATLQTAAP